MVDLRLPLHVRLYLVACWWRRLPERLVFLIARHLPPSFTYWCAIVVLSHATTGVWGSEHAPSVTAADALYRWALCNRCGGPRGRHVCAEGSR